MAPLTQRLDLRQTQALVMTPQLQQAIKLLQLSNLELAQFIETEIEQNPLLDRDDSVTEPTAEAEPIPVEAVPETPLSTEAPSLTGGEDIDAWRASSGSEGEGDVDLAGDPEAWRERNGSASGGDGGDLPGLEQTLSRGTTLREHLTGQISVDLDDPVDRIIGWHLIDMLDEAGYLVGDLTSIAELLGCDVPRVEATLAKVQRFDPPGVFARNLAECLALQLRDRNRLDPAMEALLANLPLLASRDLGALCRICRVDSEDLAEMIGEIKSLDPKPGQSFDLTLAQPIAPDVLMRPDQAGGWLVELNSETLPRVLVNTRYHATVSRASLHDKASREYLAERLQSANWLVKSLHQRATTILKVATEIVRQQDAFFRHGVQHLRPLILRDIAEAIKMHESTVSRVTSNKYIASPRGIYELKYFFTSSIASADGGDAHSAEAVRFRIKLLIDAEPVSEVLSDERIVEILQKEGIDIARRTVAKYREALRIPSSVQRRREKAMEVVRPSPPEAPRRGILPAP
jgi:RNA polymerase sigma-54 factor